MSSVMYTFLEKLEDLMEKGNVSEGVYLELCNALKHQPFSDSHEDYWREQYEREHELRMREEDHSQYLAEGLDTLETQQFLLLNTLNRLNRQNEGLKQDVEYYKSLVRKKRQDEKKDLLDFFSHMSQLSNIPRHKKKPYTTDEIENMSPSYIRLLHSKIFR